MLRTLVTLARGHAGMLAETVADRHALVILDQQMRDAAAALGRAKKALALAIAQDMQEAQRLEIAGARSGDLETRAVAAIEAGREDLAIEAAEAIAGLEAERDASSNARALFAAEIARLKAHVARQQRQLSHLERDRRIARAAEAVRVARRGRIEAAPLLAGTLADAAATLARLRQRQIAADAAETALAELDAATAPEAVADRLAAAGFGTRRHPAAAEILARIQERAAIANRPSAPEPVSRVLTAGAAR